VGRGLPTPHPISDLSAIGDVNPYVNQYYHN